MKAVVDFVTHENERLDEVSELREFLSDNNLDNYTTESLIVVYDDTTDATFFVCKKTNDVLGIDTDSTHHSAATLLLELANMYAKTEFKKIKVESVVMSF